MGAQTTLRARLEAPVIGYRALENTGNTTSVPGRTNARTELEMDARRQESGRVHEFTLINGTLRSTAVQKELPRRTTWMKISKPLCRRKAARP